MIFFFLSPAFHSSLGSEGKQLPAVEGTAGSWKAPGRVKTLAIHVEFLEAGTGWMSALTGGFGAPQGVLEFHSLSLCSAAHSTCSLSLDPAPSCPSPAASLKQSWGLSRRAGQRLGLAGSGEGFGDGSCLELAEISNLNCVISIKGEQNVLKPHIPTKPPFPRPFPAQPACCSLSATREILQGEIRAAWHSQTSSSHPGNTGRFSSSQENMEIKLESLHGCSSAQINSQAVSLQMFLAAGTSFLRLFPASQGFWKCFPSSIYGPQLCTRIEIL